MKAKRVLVALLTIAMIVSMFSPVGLAEDSGLKSPSSFNDDSGVDNEDRAYNSNNQDVAFNTSSDRVDYTHFGINIPQDATIDGITVQLEAKRSPSSSKTFDVSLYVGSSKKGDTKKHRRINHLGR